VTPDCFDSTALPDGPPHLIDRLDAAIEAFAFHERERGQWRVDNNKLRDLVDVAREARDLLDAEGFGR
jgi:hypothetical protein